jgi:ABC-type glycerol-3-phosphate transport system substrate-binding protein
MIVLTYNHSNLKKIKMKKLLFVLTLGVFAAACGGDAKTEVKTDSTAVTVDTAAKAVDTAAAKVDSTVAKVDSAAKK